MKSNDVGLILGIVAGAVVLAAYTLIRVIHHESSVHVTTVLQSTPTDDYNQYAIRSWGVRECQGTHDIVRYVIHTWPHTDAGHTSALEAQAALSIRLGKCYEVVRSWRAPGITPGTTPKEEIEVLFGTAS